MSRTACQYARLAELAAPKGDAAQWLSPDERRLLASMRSDERRLTWTAGRLLAKRMLAPLVAGDRPPSAIHIEGRSAIPGHRDRPTVFVSGNRLDCALSIAHTSRGVLVAISRELDLSLGVDLVCDGDDAPRGLQWSLSAAERCWLAARPSRSFGTLWAMKEALYKAAQQGEGFAPAQIETLPGSPARYPGLDPAAVRSLQTWRVDGHVAALAVVKRPHACDRPAARTALAAAC